jgi:hypothetical protein
MAVSRLIDTTFKKGIAKKNSFADPKVIASVPSSGLILHLDAGISASYPGSGTAWNDLSGNGNNGALSSTSGIVYGSGNGGYLSFNGSSYVTCGNSASLRSPSTGFTAFTIVYPTSWSTGVWQTILSKGDNSYRIQNKNNNYSFNFGTSGISDTDTGSNTFIQTNNWYINACVFDGSLKKIYMNNVLDKNQSVSGTLPESNFNLYIGSNEQTGSRFYTGYISVILLYNRALTETELTGLYNFYKGRYGLL